MNYQYKQVSVGLYPDDYYQLGIIAAHLNQSRSAFIRDLVHLYISNHNKQQDESN